LKNRRGLLAAVIFIVLAMVISGCNLVQVNEEKDRKTVVAKVNGVEILKGEVLDRYHSYYGGEVEEYNKEVMLSIVNSLVEEELVRQKAEEAGHVVNQEVLNRAKEDFEQAVKDYAESLKELAGEDADPNTDYEQQARDEMKQYIDASGQTEEEYLELVGKYIAIQDFLDELTKDITVEESEIEDYYQDQIKFQTEYPSLAAGYTSVTVVKEPASRLVKHILIKLSDEDTKAISDLRNEGKDEEADALREEKLESIKSKAQNALEKAKSGEDFDKLIEQYGEDPGMEMDEYKDGYKMLRDESMMPEFLEASFKLKEGEISDLVATDYGYHIIKVYEANEDDIIPLEEVKEDIRQVLISQKKSEKADEFIAQWMEEADIKIYENRL
jgi:foldase protein PrsA